MTGKEEKYDADVTFESQSFTRRLLGAIREAHDLFLTTQQSRPAFDSLLQSLISLTGSEYGFLDEVLEDERGERYKLSLALSDISWDEGSRALHAELVSRRLEFRDLNNLAGAAVTTGRRVIANDAPRDPRWRGLPGGHPPVLAFMGLPLYFGGSLVGVAGVANRPSGYDDDLADALAPLLSTCASIIYGERQRERMRSHVEKIERSEHAQDETNRVLFAILDNTNAMTVLLDRELNFIWVNRAYAQACRLDPSFFPGENHFALYPHAENEAIFRRVIATGEPFFVTAKPFEFPDQPKRGVTYWDWSVIPIKEPGGEVNRLVFTLLDVTDRVLAEARSRALAEMLDMAPSSVTVHNHDGRFRYANRKTMELHQFSEEEFMALGLSEIDVPESGALFAERIRKILEEGEATFEVGHFRKDGSVLPLEVSVRPFDWSGEQVFLSVGRDITERKRSEAKLKRAYLQLKALWKTSDMMETAQDRTIADHILATLTEMTDSRHGFFGHMNDDETVMTIHAWSGEAMEDCGVVERPADFVIAECGLWADAVRRREPLIVNDYDAPHAAKRGLPTGHVPIRNLLVVPLIAKGRTLFVAAVANRDGGYQQDDAHQMTTFLSGIQNLIERRKTESALRESEVKYRALAQKNAELFDLSHKDAQHKSILLHEVNHRVKNNLTAVIGLLYAQQRFIRSDLHDDFQAVLKDLAGRIETLAMVHNMLSATRWEPLSLSGLFDKIMSAAAKLTPAGKQLLHDFSGEDATIPPREANSMALLLFELTSNTIKHGLIDGRPSRVTLFTEWTDEGLSMHYRDDGPGYPEAVLESGQVNLGLYLVRTLTAHDLRGEVSLSNDRGAVTTVRVGIDSGVRHLGGERDEPFI